MGLGDLRSVGFAPVHPVTALEVERRLGVPLRPDPVEDRRLAAEARIGGRLLRAGVHEDVAAGIAWARSHGWTHR